MAKTKAKTKAAPKTKAVAAANPLEELVDLTAHGWEFKLGTNERRGDLPGVRIGRGGRFLDAFFKPSTEIMDHIRKETQPGSETYAALWRED